MILDVIYKRKNINSTKQLSKILRSIEDLKYYPDLKQDLIKNYIKYVSELESNRMIDQIGSYNLSKKGKNVLSKMRKIRSYESLISFAYGGEKPLEMWKEKDLKKYR